MRLPRFRLRTLMIAVAVVGVILFVGIEGHRLRRLSQLRSRRAVQVASYETICLRGAVLQDRQARECEEGAPESLIALERSDPRLLDARLANARAIRNFAKKLRGEAGRWAQIRRNYERAARYPWLPVEPDPPMPE